MQKRKVAIHRFTFEDDSTEMLVHVFRLDVSLSSQAITSSAPSSLIVPIDASIIRPCVEIVPQWFDDWHDIPLDNMFADDSLWLTDLLSSKEHLYVDGYFHFKPGGQDVNTILHYYMDVRRRKGQAKPSLERRLFHKIHSNKINSPSIKEFKEAFAFTNAVRSFFGKKSFDLIIDVAGGHGSLAALLLIMSSANEAVVIDPSDVGRQDVSRAWGEHLRNKTLRYRYECLRTGLPSELDITAVDMSRILVVACHACQHLSDEILSIACRYGALVAVMPCCQKDLSPGSSWKDTSKNLGIPIGKVMDILLAGKAMSWDVGKETNHSYDVRMKTINADITPQNRIILCRPVSGSETSKSIEKAHKKLEVAYQKAHQNGQRSRDIGNQRSLREFMASSMDTIGKVSLGVVIGALFSAAVRCRR